MTKNEKYHRNTYKYLYDSSQSDIDRINQIIKDRQHITNIQCGELEYDDIPNEILAIEMLTEMADEMSKAIHDFAEKKDIDPLDEVFRGKWLTHHKITTITNKLLFKQVSDALKTRELIANLVKMKAKNSTKREYESYIEKVLMPVDEVTKKIKLSKEV